MKPVNVVLLGAGSRGTYAYGEYARRNPKMLKIIAVAEPNEAKRKNFQIEHNLPEDRVFSDWEEAFAKMPEDAEGVIIATQDKMHAGPLSQAMARNMHILCEKPIVPTFEECRDLEKKSGAFTKTFMIGHVLKYTSFFSKIYDLLKPDGSGTSSV
jgi:predicted dehydrogenase